MEKIIIQKKEAGNKVFTLTAERDGAYWFRFAISSLIIEGSERRSGDTAYLGTKQLDFDVCKELDNRKNPFEPMSEALAGFVKELWKEAETCRGKKISYPFYGLGLAKIPALTEEALAKLLKKRV